MSFIMHIVLQSKLNFSLRKNITKMRKKSKTCIYIKTGIGIQKNWTFSRLKFVSLFCR